MIITLQHPSWSSHYKTFTYHFHDQMSTNTALLSSLLETRVLKEMEAEHQHTVTQLPVYTETYNVLTMHASFFFRISHVFRRDNMNSCLDLCIWRMGRYWSECWYFPIVHNYLCNLLPLLCYMYIYIIVFGHNSSTKTSMFANSRHLMHKMCSNSSHVQLLIELIGMFQTWGG